MCFNREEDFISRYYSITKKDFVMSITYLNKTKNLKIDLKKAMKQQDL